MKELVSVIIPCYNCSSYIGESIRSVVSQNYRSLEIIVIDDGSDDDSWEKICSVDDDRIKKYKISNSGAAVARNLGLSVAKGEFIKFLDADDWLDKDVLKKQVDQIRLLKHNQIPFGDLTRVNKSGEEIDSLPFRHSNLLKADQCAFFIRNTEIVTASPLHRKSLLLNIGGFDESLTAGQEVDLHFRLSLSGVEFIYFPGNIYYYRQYTSKNRISSRSWVQREKQLGFNQLKGFENKLVTVRGYLTNLQKESLSIKHFKYARYLFRVGDTINGVRHLEECKKLGMKMELFGKGSLAWLYLSAGRIFGYCIVERLLWRFRNNSIL